MRFRRKNGEREREKKKNSVEELLEIRVIRGDERFRKRLHK